MGNYNIYELLYMHHRGCTYAGRLMEEEMRSWINKWVYEKVDANKALLSGFVQELKQEALLGLYDAMDTYRLDMDTGFLTFLKVVLDRRMQNFMRTLKENEVQKVSIDEELTNAAGKYCLKEILAQADGLTSPEYALHFSESYDLLMGIINDMKAGEKEVLYAWLDCEDRHKAAVKLQLPDRAFGSKLRRARLKIKEEYRRKSRK